jgi:membrane-bound lytic murein transglycosylase D
MTAKEMVHSTSKHKTALFHKQATSVALTGKQASSIVLPIKQTSSITQPGKQGMKFVSRYIRNNDDCLTNVKQRSEGPFAIIDSVLDHYHLPLQLKYLAVIESELKASAVSRVGARGPWQLMPSTAHVLGLKVNRRSDERTNYYKSTKAAAEYLRDLHREFGDWLLVLAAYNGGPRPVYRAIHKSHSRNFWALQSYLPAESRQHVKKFIATAYYFENVANSVPIAARTPQPQAQSQVQAQTQSQSQSQVQAQVQAQPVTRMTAPVKTASPATAAIAKPAGMSETDSERFSRLMRESAASLKASNDLLLPNGN